MVIEIFGHCLLSSPYPPPFRPKKQVIMSVAKAGLFARPLFDFCLLSELERIHCLPGCPDLAGFDIKDGCALDFAVFKGSVGFGLYRLVSRFYRNVGGGGDVEVIHRGFLCAYRAARCGHVYPHPKYTVAG